MNPFVEALLAAQTDAGCRLTYGVVTQASPLLVMVGSSTVAISARRLGSYTPTLSDVVAVLVQDADRLVIGKVT